MSKVESITTASPQYRVWLQRERRPSCRATHAACHPRGTSRALGGATEGAYRQPCADQLSIGAVLKTDSKG